jgi:hypothetical protein
MSTVVYAHLTSTREAAQPGTSTLTQPPSVSTYVDAMAALVPSEVLTLHAVVLSFTTHVDKETTTITAPETLKWSFYGFIVMAIVLYVVSRAVAKKWDQFDFARMFIPAFAFVAWTALQRTTAFDAAFLRFAEWPSKAEGTALRTVGALFLAVILGMAASYLAYQADQKPS